MQSQPSLRFLLCVLPVGAAACAPALASPTLASGTPQLNPNLRDSALREQLEKARARSPLWGESPLWSRSPLHDPQSNGEVTRGQFFNALSDQMPKLGELRDWRSTLRGHDRFGAPAKTRGLNLGQPMGTKAQLQLGAQALPQWSLANFAAMSQNGAAPASVLKWGRVQAGSTEPLRAANRALRSFDELTEENLNLPPQPEAPRLTWLSARAVENKKGNLDLLAARGSRALLPGTNGQTPEGTVWGGRGEMALLPNQLNNWKLRGEWLGSRLENQDNTSQAWNVGVDGPVAHPFGEARVSAGISETDPGFAPFSDPSAVALAQNAERRRRKQVTVAQDAKLALPVLGTVSGTLSAGATRSNRKNLTEIGESDIEPASREIRTDELTGTADLRWQLFPAIAITGRHAHGLITETRPDAETAPENLTRRNDSDAGVELKMSRSLAFTVGAGQTRIGNATLPPETASSFEPLSAGLRDEERVTVGLQHRTGGGAWSLRLARRMMDNNTLDGGNFSDGAGDTLAHTLDVDAERRFFGWINLRGGWSLTDEDTFARGNDGFMTPAGRRAQQRRAEAQILLPFRSRFEVRYQDWEQLSAQGTSPWNATGESREYGARYLLGAQGDQAGLGFSVEYSRRDMGAGDPLDTWRVGVTYR